MSLNKKQERFCHEYVVDLNGKQAAIRAGYADKTAEVQASRLLSFAKVQELVAKLISDRSKKTEITAEFVLQSLREVAMRCMQKVPVMEFDYINKCMVQKEDDEGNGIWEFDSNGANKALELLGKHLALFTDKKEVKTDLNIKSVSVEVIPAAVPISNSEKEISA